MSRSLFNKCSKKITVLCISHRGCTRVIMVNPKVTFKKQQADTYKIKRKIIFAPFQGL